MNYQSYQTFYNQCTLPFRSRPRLLKTILIIEKICVLAMISIYTAFCGYALLGYGIYWETILPTVFLPGLCLFVVSVLQKLIARPRPYQATGANIQPLMEKGRENNSFPSRHTASAFVIGTVLLAYFPWIGILCFAIGLYIAFVRFLSGMHYLSDVIAGILLGVGFGLIAFF